MIWLDSCGTWGKICFVWGCGKNISEQHTSLLAFRFHDARICIQIFLLCNKMRRCAQIKPILILKTKRRNQKKMHSVATRFFTANFYCDFGARLILSCQCAILHQLFQHIIYQLICDDQLFLFFWTVCAGRTTWSRNITALFIFFIFNLSSLGLKIKEQGLQDMDIKIIRFP